jgi:molybdate transport system substrate-binding protein
LVAACAGGSSAEAEIVVFAAASLTEAFADLGAAFEGATPGVSVVLSFGPSSGLATQIIEGAPADVFASADERWMDEVGRTVGVRGRAGFATNDLVLIVPAGDPAGVGGLRGLTAPGVRLVLAAEEVPAGRYAREVLERAGLAEAALGNLVSDEEDVKGVVQKVVLGEADVGLVYRTDVNRRVAPDVDLVEISPDVNVTARLVIAAIGTVPDRWAEEFVGFVLGPAGREILGRHGFGGPEE